MYKIKFLYKYFEVLNKFLEGYKNSFKKLYTDTGIDNEYFFHKGYIENARKIKYELANEIKNILQEEIVAHKFQDNQKSIKIFIKSFMFEVFYEED